MLFRFKTILLNLALLMALAGNAQAAERTIRILALGDSLTSGYGLPNGSAFPDVLERALKAQHVNVTLINAGVAGDTSSDGLARLDWTLSDPKNTPDAAIVELGANDALRGLPPAEMERNLDAILAKLKARNIPVLLAGMKSPRNLGPAYAAEYDAVFARLSKKYNTLLYPFFLDGVVLDRSLIQTDGLHPNAKGLDVIVKNIAPSVVKLVQQVSAKSTDGQSAR
jgi:acyl-CoA thioesterase-1